MKRSMTSLITAALLASFACTEASAIDLTSVDYDKTSGIVEVSGHSERLDADKLVIHLLDSGVGIADVKNASDDELLASTVWFYVDELDDNGEFKLELNMCEIADTEGRFTLRVAANGEKNAVSSFSFFRKETMDSEIQKASDTVSAEELAVCTKTLYEMFVDNKDMKALTDKIILKDDGSYNEDNISKAAGILFSMKSPEGFSTDYDEFEKCMEKSIAVSALKDNGSTFKIMFLNYMDVFEIGFANKPAFKRLKSLSDESLEIIADDLISLGLTCKTDAEFNNALEFSALKELMSTTYGVDGKEEVLRLFGDKLNFTVFEMADNDREKVINGIQNSIDSGNIKNLDDIQQKLDTYIEESSSGTGKGSGASGSSGGAGSYVPGITGINTQIVTKIEDTAVLFDDIDDVPWARGSINRLSELGIINGIGENKFAPNEYVTRAQFAKILCNCFGIVTDDSLSSSVDVDNDSWYAPYVSALEKRKIVKGMGNGRFGVDEYITRQDMAVIICNAGKEIFNVSDISELPFADADDIADYARQSVAVLKYKNLISGMEDGSFAPLSNATRAETAKLMDNVEKFIKNYLN